jgi:hypothetical protein
MWHRGNQTSRDVDHDLRLQRGSVLSNDRSDALIRQGDDDDVGFGDAPERTRCGAATGFFDQGSRSCRVPANGLDSVAAGDGARPGPGPCFRYR